MTAGLSPDVMLAGSSVLAGITACAGLACLVIWLYDRTRRAFWWASLLGLTMTLALACSAIVFARPGGDLTTAAVLLRATFYGVSALCAVEAAGHLMPGLPVRWISRVILALLVVRTAFWSSLSLFVRPGTDVDGWPEYGPLVWSVTLYNLAIVVLCVLAYRRSAGLTRAVIVGCGAAVTALTAAPGLMRSPAAVEEMITLNVLPGGIAILFLVGRTLWRVARSHDRLGRRQAVILRLSQAAVTEPVDSLRRRVERELRAELGSEVVVAVSGPDRIAEPGMAADAVAETVAVTGRRQRALVRGLGPVSEPTRQFVESALRVLVAAVERALSEADHAHAAGHDHLTGLANLVALSGRLDDRLHAGDWPLDGAARFAALQCRLVGLEQLAAIDGAERTDDLVREVADVLAALRRSRTIVARISADTFCIADQVPPDESETFLADRLCEVRAALTAAVPDAIVSIGAAEAASGTSATSLLSDAAMALEVALPGGEARFDDSVGADMRERVALERDLARAVERDEIEVLYQPVVTAATRAVVSVEALARWRRNGVATPPATWIPVAERLGLIHAIGLRVLAIAARDQARLGVPVAVNVSPLQLAEPTFLSDVLTAIGDCPPRRLVLEMTETAVMADLARSVTLLEELRSHGILIALDDFGSSYSSLSALTELPVDVLKLDASFVARLDQPNGVAIVEAVAALGRSLGKPIVAEGVETREQLDLLVAYGVDRAQGYLLGRPAPADTIAGDLLVVGAVSQVG